MSDSPLLYMLYVRCRGLMCEVRVNDVVVYRGDGQTPETYGEKINLWLQPGENIAAASLSFPKEVRAVAAPGTPPSAPAFSLLIQSGQQGEDPATIQTLLQHNWSVGRQPVSVGELRPVLRQPFQAPQLAYRAQWFDSSPATMDIEVAQAFVRDYAELIRTKAIDAVVEANRFKLEELSKSLGVGLARQLEQLREYLADMMGEKDFAITAHQVVSVASQGGGRLSVLSAADGAAPVSVTAGGIDIPFPLTLCLITKQWRIVR